MTEEELISETIKFEEYIYQILKKVIDDEVEYSNANHFDEVDTYIYIQKKLERSYEIMSSLLSTSTSDNYTWLIEHFPNIEFKLLYYMYTFMQKAIKEIQAIVNEVLNSKTSEEFENKFNYFKVFVLSKEIFRYDDLLLKLEIDESALFSSQLKAYIEKVLNERPVLDTAFEEYIDMFLKEQKNPNALYYVISFDVEKSRESKNRELLSKNLDYIMKYVYDKLKEIEKNENRQILISDNKFYHPWDINNANGIYCDPSILGDNIQFTVLRDTVTREEIISIVDKCKRDLNMEENFHIADGYYETNEYEEGNSKLFRGYCLAILEKLHKPYMQERINVMQEYMDKIFTKSK